MIGSPFGLKGFVKIKSLSGETAHIAEQKKLHLKQGNTKKLYDIEGTMPFGAGDSSFLLVKFRGFDDPESAKILAGAEIIAERSYAAPLKKDEFYIEDLKGFAVIAESAAGSEILGHITDILEGGGGNLAEIKLITGETRLVPFRNEFFGEVSLETQKTILLEKWILE